jgi:hypothetical protein
VLWRNLQLGHQTLQRASRVHSETILRVYLLHANQLRGRKKDISNETGWQAIEMLGGSYTECLQKNGAVLKIY